MSDAVAGATYRDNPLLVELQELRARNNGLQAELSLTRQHNATLQSLCDSSAERHRHMVQVALESDQALRDLRRELSEQRDRAKRFSMLALSMVMYIPVHTALMQLVFHGGWRW